MCMEFDLAFDFELCMYLYLKLCLNKALELNLTGNTDFYLNLDHPIYQLLDLNFNNYFIWDLP